MTTVEIFAKYMTDAWVAAGFAMAVLYFDSRDGSYSDAVFARRLRWLAALKGVTPLVPPVTALGALAAYELAFPMNALTTPWGTVLARAVVFGVAFGAAFLLGRELVPKLVHGSKVLVLERQDRLTLSVHVTVRNGVAGVFSRPNLAGENHARLMLSTLVPQVQLMRADGWKRIELVSPEISLKSLDGTKVTELLSRRMPGWTSRSVCRRMALRRAAAYNLTRAGRRTDPWVWLERGIVLEAP
jgi:hypothetical protein